MSSSRRYSNPEVEKLIGNNPGEAWQVVPETGLMVSVDRNAFRRKESQA